MSDHTEHSDKEQRLPEYLDGIVFGDRPKDERCVEHKLLKRLYSLPK